MARKLTRMAIAYDFDGTLAPGNMQEHSFIPDLNIPKGDFWKEVKGMAKDKDMDEVLAYMWLMLEKAHQAKLPITLKDFKKHGKGIPLFSGVKEWFPRLDNYARDRGVKLDHYIISSGLREMVKETSIGTRFKYIYASGFLYDQNGVAVWPSLAVNYTTKTQYLFRINKGIQNSYDNATINKYVPDLEREIPFSNMAYIGDGETDIPCMKLLKHQGGLAVAVYSPNKRGAKKTSQQLIEESRADHALVADYQEDGHLDQLMKAFIDKVAASARMSSPVPRRKRTKSTEYPSAPDDAPDDTSKTAKTGSPNT